MGPVHDRAWSFQEKLLYQRILHAVDEKFVWQCASLVQSENGWPSSCQVVKELDSRLPKEVNQTVGTSKKENQLSYLYTR
jgi:hypothetical protein